jgi:hypothetical protein
MQNNYKKNKIWNTNVYFDKTEDYEYKEFIQTVDMIDHSLDEASINSEDLENI